MKTRWLEVFFISVVMTIVSFGIPTFIPNCTPKPSNMEDWTDQEKDLSSRLVPLYCDPETEYSQTGSLFLTDSDTAIKQLFHFREIGDDAEPTFSSGSLVLFFLPYITLACLNYGAAVPSGLFVPSLLQGKCAVYVVPCCVAPFVLLYYLCISFCSVILVVIFLIIYWI